MGGASKGNMGGGRGIKREHGWWEGHQEGTWEVGGASRGNMDDMLGVPVISYLHQMPGYVQTQARTTLAP